jgi:hypothetical protein
MNNVGHAQLRHLIQRFGIVGSYDELSRIQFGLFKWQNKKCLKNIE